MPDHRSKNMHAYNRNAAAYAERFKDYTPYNEERDRFIALLDPESRVLDSGCGPGINASAFRRVGHRVTGIDLSEGMITEAERRCPDGEFHKADLTDLPDLGVFDAVFASFCIVHLDDNGCSVFLKQLPKLLRSGGLLYISFMDGKTPGMETTSFSKDPIYFNYYDRNSIRKQLEELGFQLLYENCVGFKETDGTVTDEVFFTWKMQSLQ